MIERIGIITGVDAEAAALFSGQSAHGEPLHGFLVRQVRFAGKDIAITCSGIGKVNAAMAAMMLVDHYEVQLLMVVGTAGKLTDINADCFQITEAVQGDYGASRHDHFAHYSAGAWPIGEEHVEVFRAKVTPDIGLPKARIITTDSFIENPDQSRRLQETLGGDIIDMETAAVAQAAARMDLSWAAIKATTDNADGDSSGDFQSNLKRAAKIAAAAAERMISAL
ncbi:MAG: purine phosphorylase [Sphingorhabdus sp.]|uniref:5'-methylthioadenosine/S-adenosylhomocysteine nucleosidase family protein n=1 Tax=Sphingorhabdus sp. TaxID=1902408 RepID=UPI0038FC7192